MSNLVYFLLIPVLATLCVGICAQIGVAWLFYKKPALLQKSLALIGFSMVPFALVFLTFFGTASLVVEIAKL